MKRKGFKTILTLCMALFMLFGSVLTVSAEETTVKTTFEQNLDKYFKVTNSVEFVGGSGIDSKPMSVYRTEFSEMVYVGAFKEYRPDLENNYMRVWFISENSSVKYGTLSVNTTESNLQTQLEREISQTFSLSSTMTIDGKTYYYAVTTLGLYDSYSGSCPVYALPEDVLLNDASSMQNVFGTDVDLPIIGGDSLEDSEMIFDENIPTPELSFIDDGRLRFGFNNATDDYCIEIKGRWWSVDDIELFKENLMWKYKYSSLVKNDLSTWVANSIKTSASGEHDLSVYGASSFNELLSMYPVDNRSYSGGTNAVGNFFSGYNDAMDTLKMLLNTPSTLYNSCEIYVRYYVVDENGNYSYGKWCHWLGNLAKESGSSVVYH